MQIELNPTGWKTQGTWGVSGTMPGCLYDDNDSTNIYQGSTGQTCAVNKAVIPGWIVDPINWVKQRAKVSLAANLGMDYYRTGVGASGSWSIASGGSGWYTSAALAAPGGNPWTNEKFNSTDTHMRAWLNSTGGVYILEWRALVDGTLPAVGGFVCVIGELLGPVIGAAVLLREAVDVARLLRRRGVWLTEDEVRRGWQSLREPRRVHVF